MEADTSGLDPEVVDILMSDIEVTLSEDHLDGQVERLKNELDISEKEATEIYEEI